MTLQTLPPDAKASEIVAAMQRDGACIVRDVLSKETLARLNADLKPWIDRSEPGMDDFTGRFTKRTGALIARCPESRPVVTHPLILEAANEFLGPYCERIQLHLTQTIAILPGQPVQVLHRDRLAWGGYIPKSIEPQFNTIWALTDFTQENGATELIPGSHLWGPGEVPSEEDARTFKALMPAGSVLVWQGPLFHRGGANDSSRTRLGITLQYCQPWLRQIENMVLAVPPETAAQYSKRVRAMLGYDLMGMSFMGYVDGRNPRKLVEVCADDGGDDDGD